MNEPTEISFDDNTLKRNSRIFLQYTAVVRDPVSGLWKYPSLTGQVHHIHACVHGCERWRCRTQNKAEACALSCCSAKRDLFIQV